MWWGWGGTGGEVKLYFVHVASCRHLCPHDSMHPHACVVGYTTVVEPVYRLNSQPPPHPQPASPLSLLPSSLPSSTVLSSWLFIQFIHRHNIRAYLLHHQAKTNLCPMETPPLPAARLPPPTLKNFFLKTIVLIYFAMKR